jgi:hypothetical protein
MSTKFLKDRASIVSLEVGAKVRALGGAFAGRVGVLSKLDGKGGATVTFGLLSARVLVEDLGPFGVLGRPSLHSSHRKLDGKVPDDVRNQGGRSKKSRSPKRKPIP